MSDWTAKEMVSLLSACNVFDQQDEFILPQLSEAKRRAMATDLVALLPDAKKADFTDKFKPGLDGVKSYLDGIQALMKTPVGAAK